MPRLQDMPLEITCHILDLAHVDVEPTPLEDHSLITYWYDMGMAWSPAHIGN